MTQTCRWAVLSTARIAVERVIPAIRSLDSHTIVAIAARDLGRAEDVARRFGVPRAYGSYEDLPTDDFDCLYLPLPNSLHREWACRFLAAGKAVLCEKPLAVTPHDAEEMVAVAKAAGALLGEAFMYRHHPQVRHLLDLVRNDVLGDVQVVRGSICFRRERADDIRLDPALGGGALLDVGCYALDAACLVFGAEPVRARGLSFGRGGVDELGAVAVEFPGERVAVLDYNFRLPRLHSAALEVLGTTGSCRLENAYNPGPADAHGTLMIEGRQPEALRFAGMNAYAAMADSFAAAFRGDSEPLYPIEQSLVTARAVDLVRNAVQAPVSAQLHAHG